MHITLVCTILYVFIVMCQACALITISKNPCTVTRLRSWLHDVFISFRSSNFKYASLLYLIKIVGVIKQHILKKIIFMNDAI